jgi:hypothetical protein|tara:strand:- start:1746 stop:1991 length:246 start_codon:yes stop_codon:yes gene_type:complete
MPLYTVVNEKTGETEDCFCSYVRLQKRLKELGSDWKQQIGAPALISGTGNVVNKTSSDWKDHLKNIEKGAGGKRQGVDFKR